MKGEQQALLYLTLLYSITNHNMSKHNRMIIICTINAYFERCAFVLFSGMLFSGLYLQPTSKIIGRSTITVLLAFVVILNTLYPECFR